MKVYSVATKQWLPDKWKEEKGLMKVQLDEWRDLLPGQGLKLSLQPEEWLSTLSPHSAARIPPKLATASECRNSCVCCGCHGSAVILAWLSCWSYFSHNASIAWLPWQCCYVVMPWLPSKINSNFDYSDCESCYQGTNNVCFVKHGSGSVIVNPPPYRPAISGRDRAIPLNFQKHVQLLDARTN